MTARRDSSSSFRSVAVVTSLLAATIAGPTARATAQARPTTCPPSPRLGDRTHPGLEPLRIYLDVDLTVNTASGRAIELGIRTGLDECGWQLDGFPVELVVLDHRGSTPRSRRNLDRAAADERTIALFGGMHSPPLLDRRDWIQHRRLLTLVPWAAATGITRPAEGEENWIFRLSVDDSMAGEVIVDRLVARGVRSPLLLLDNTGWGRANERTILHALSERDMRAHRVQWIRWGVSEQVMLEYLRDAVARGADGVALVANGPEALIVLRAMRALPPEERIPIFSHWGIAGTDIAAKMGVDDLLRLDVEVLQTDYPFFAIREDPFGSAVFDRARELSAGWLEEPADMVSPNGFVHAYDLVRLLGAAAEQAVLTGDAARDRRRIKHALEHLQAPVRGLMRTYDRPFTPWTPSVSDAHEALDRRDLAMARYAADGRLHVERLRDRDGDRFDGSRNARGHTAFPTPNGR